MHDSFTFLLFAWWSVWPYYDLSSSSRVPVVADVVDTDYTEGWLVKCTHGDRHSDDLSSLQEIPSRSHNKSM